MGLGTSPLPADPRLRLWKRILQVLQNRAGSLSHNNPNDNDALRPTLVKVLRSLNGT
jgi:hypothetical protein